MRGSEFAALLRRVKAAGLLERRYGYYAARIAVNILLFGVGGIAFGVLGDSWWQMFTAALFAVVLTQFAFVGHDAGHRQIFTSRRGNDFVGYAHGALTGLSYDWWVGKHNRHHANPNHEGADPDIDIPALAFSAEQALAKRGLLRWVAKRQAFLFVPLLMTQAIMLHAASIRAVVRREVKAPWLEAALLAVHILGFLLPVFLVLSPLKAVAFIAIHQGLMGIYLGCSFAPNHKGMPIIGGDVKRLPTQTSTHLQQHSGQSIGRFPPRRPELPNRTSPVPGHASTQLASRALLVQEFCAQRSVTYVQCGLFHSYADVLRHLHEVGAPLRRAHLVAATR